MSCSSQEPNLSSKKTQCLLSKSTRRKALYDPGKIVKIGSRKVVKDLIYLGSEVTSDQDISVEGDQEKDSLTQHRYRRI